MGQSATLTIRCFKSKAGGGKEEKNVCRSCVTTHNNKGRFNTSKLQANSVNDDGELTTRGEFRNQMCERLKESMK